MRLVYVGPLPPEPSGIADYGAALLTALRPHCERLLAAVDGYAPELPAGLLDGVLDVQTAIRCIGEAGLPLYQMGSHPRYHRYVYEMLCRVPGITVIHDGNLLPFMLELTVGSGQPAVLSREAGFERGGLGCRATWRAIAGGGPLEAHEYPMLARVARSSLGVIVHSACLLERVRALAPAVPAARVAHLDLVGDHALDQARGKSREALGFGPDDLVIGAFGYIGPTRHLEPALRAYARLRVDFPRARFVCVGQPSPDYDFRGILERMDLSDSVQVTGYVEHDVLERYLQGVDIGVNLRWPTWGEMSGMAIRLMAHGVATLVTDAGAFAELPDESVEKIRPTEQAAEAILAALRRLAADAPARRALGLAAREYITQNCDPAVVADSFVAFIDEALGMARCPKSAVEGHWQA